MKFHKISWKDYHQACITLVKKIKNLRIDKIVAISRGGLVPARILSDLTGISISHITIESYQSLKQKKYLTITEVPSTNFNDKTLLIVDDVADTGRTFKRAISYFKNFRVKKIFTLAPYLKSQSKHIPDFWAKKIDAWLIFPYELRETQKAFLKLFKSKEKAKNKLLEVGFKEWEL
ncbi:hypothetical protein HY407_00840 [Candidatus Gottesmanbacteria bacterium]|nr:hypothetical protein [Candidatus Gottesmanbacteria bacterium]